MRLRLASFGCICLLYAVLIPDNVGHVADGDHCELGESSYTNKNSYLVLVQSSKTRKTSTHTEHCSWLWWWCKQILVTKYVTAYFTEYKTRNNYTTVCCPGFVTEQGGVCIEGCESGKFGENCTQNCSCPEHAFTRCEKKAGNCTCHAGWTGQNCTKECYQGHFGLNCEGRCSCENNSTCNIYTGTCNCTMPGWHGTSCDIACEETQFGTNCEETCACHVNQSCDPVTGSCTCIPGRKGTNCENECTEGFYGKDCLSNCTCNTTNTDRCDVISGQCACKAGFRGSRCHYGCPFDSYGDGCNFRCSDRCNNTEYCDSVTGDCLCIGKSGHNCSQDCSPGTFGINCQRTCTCDSSEVCDPIFGNCSSAHHESDSTTGNTEEFPQKTNSGHDDPKLPTILSASIGGVIAIAIIIIIIFVVRRRRIQRQEREAKRRPTDSSDTYYVTDNSSYIPLETIQKKGPNVHHAEQGLKTDESGKGNHGNVKGDVNTDGSVNDVYENPDQDLSNYGDAKPLSKNYGPNIYNTFNDIKQTQTIENTGTNQDFDGEYNVLSQVRKPNHVAQENYSTFEMVRKENEKQNDLQEDTYNVLNEPRGVKHDTMETYGTAEHSAESGVAIKGEIGEVIDNDTDGEFENDGDTYENHQIGHLQAEVAHSDVDVDALQSDVDEEQVYCNTAHVDSELYENV